MIIGPMRSGDVFGYEIGHPGAQGGALKGVNKVKFQNVTPPSNIKLK